MRMGEDRDASVTPRVTQPASLENAGRTLEANATTLVASVDHGRLSLFSSGA
jgi:hypothetical protein